MSSRQNASGKRVAPAVPDLSRPLNRCMVKRPENGETKIQNGNQQLEFFFFFRGVLSNMGLSPLVPAFFSGTGGTPWVSGGMNKYGDLPAGRRVHDEEVGRPSHHKGSRQNVFRQNAAGKNGSFCAFA